MASLGFSVLDRQVIDGHGTALALHTDEVQLSYADLLEKVAAIAGALQQLGVAPGDEVALDLPTRHHHVIAVLACMRLGAVPCTSGAECGPNSAVRFASETDGTYVHAADGSFDWRTMIKAGAMNPAPALDEDPDGYAEIVRPAFDDILSALGAGRTVT